jgi:hypothetical protein
MTGPSQGWLHWGGVILVKGTVGKSGWDGS